MATTVINCKDCKYWTLMEERYGTCGILGNDSAYNTVTGFNGAHGDYYNDVVSFFTEPDFG